MFPELLKAPKGSDLLYMSGNATCIRDHEGVLRDLPPLKLGYEGSRIWENVAPQSSSTFTYTPEFNRQMVITARILTPGSSVSAMIEANTHEINYAQSEGERTTITTDGLYITTTSSPNAFTMTVTGDVADIFIEYVDRQTNKNPSEYMPQGMGYSDRYNGTVVIGRRVYDHVGEKIPTSILKGVLIASAAERANGDVGYGIAGWGTGGWTKIDTVRLASNNNRIYRLEETAQSALRYTEGYKSISASETGRASFCITVRPFGNLSRYLSVSLTDTSVSYITYLFRFDGEGSLASIRSQGSGISIIESEIKKMPNGEYRILMLFNISSAGNFWSILTAGLSMSPPNRSYGYAENYQGVPGNGFEISSDLLVIGGVDEAIDYFGRVSREQGYLETAMPHSADFCISLVVSSETASINSSSASNHILSTSDSRGLDWAIEAETWLGADKIEFSNAGSAVKFSFSHSHLTARKEKKLEMSAVQNGATINAEMRVNNAVVATASITGVLDHSNGGVMNIGVNPLSPTTISSRRYKEIQVVRKKGLNQIGKGKF